MESLIRYMLIGSYIALVQALILGLIVSLFDSGLGTTMFGVVFGWQFVGLIYARIKKRKS